MTTTTLCFLVDGDKVCLAMKKRGFGVGKWNGVGGKVGKGESIKEAAVRELKEEVGVDANGEKLDEVGCIRFSFSEKPQWNQKTYVFLIKEWNGLPEETEEMAPKWYHKDRLPYENMWVDDPYWLPKVLEGKKVDCKFHFIKDGDEIEKFKVREI